MTGECTFEWEQDDIKRQQLPTIGFLSYFKLINGFEKPLFKTVPELKAHASKYSKTYNKPTGKWNTDFDAMCAKTVIKEILSKWGPLSIDMALAMQSDQSIVKSIDEGKFEYPDNPVQDAVELTDDEAEKIANDAKADQVKQAELDLEATLAAKKNGAKK